MRGDSWGAGMESFLSKSQGFTSPASPSACLLAQYCAHTCTPLRAEVGEGTSHDNMGNHEVEKVEKREVKRSAEAGLPSPEVCHHLLTDCPLPTKGEGHPGRVSS